MDVRACSGDRGERGWDRDSKNIGNDGTEPEGRREYRGGDVELGGLVKSPWESGSGRMGLEFRRYSGLDLERWFRG